MATYCTPSDVRAALTPLGVADSSQTAASLEDWQLEDAIDEAEGVVNAFTQDYLITPVTLTVPDHDDPNNVGVWLVAPDPIRRWTRDIAAYLATLTFRKNKDLTADDPVRLRYNQTMALLQDVRSGVYTLPLPPSTEDLNSQVEIFNKYEGTLFSLEDFRLGPDGQHVQTRIPASLEYGCW